MALIEIRTLSSNTQLGLWHITETVEELYFQYPYLSVYREYIDCKFHSDSRKKEFLTIRVLLAVMTGDHSLRIYHHANGRPLLSNGKNISISHTRGYATLIISDIINTAIDIEYRSDRVSKIAHKFIRDDETAQDAISQLIHWSAKETTYKYFSSYDLQYFDMKLQKLGLSEKGLVIVENLRCKSFITVAYEVTDDYVMTYVCEE